MVKIATNAGMDAASAAQTASQNNSLTKAKALGGRDLQSPKEIDKAAGGFEALLLHEMLKSMWATVDTTGLLGEDSNQAQIWRDMLNQSIADSVASGKGIGVKEFLARELTKESKDPHRSGEAVTGATVGKTTELKK